MDRNHDALDAACAPLVAGLRRVNLTAVFGATNVGGDIWMPDWTTRATPLTAKKYWSVPAPIWRSLWTRARNGGRNLFLVRQLEIAAHFNV
jgi:hypothetical protein